MSKMKKLASVLLALVMALAMTCTAFADTTTYTITINNSTDGYTYYAYQIFAGDLSEDGSTLSNITWGTGIDSTNETLLATLNTTYGTTDAAAIAALIKTEAQAAAFAEIIADYVTTGTESVYDSDAENYTITVEAAGYYLVINTIVPDGDYAYSDYIMEVVDNVEVNTKSTSTPGFDKSVGTTEDGDTANTDEATEDYAIGDDVPFTLTATLPDSYSAYITYELIFHDELSSGLSFNNDVVVTVTDTYGNVTTVATGYKVVTTGLDDDCTFEVQIADTNALYDASGDPITVGSGYVITVAYTAKLTDDAATVENNTAYLEYSNNPNGTSTGTTTTDKTYVVTFDVVVNKTTSDGETALSGAAFTLYKETDVDADTDFTATNYYTINDGVVTLASAYVDGTTYYVEVETISTGTTFTFEGLDIGNYVLVETATPDGYNTADPIYFTIAAEAVEGTTGVEVTITSPTTTDGFTVDASAQTLTTIVKNYAGSELPSTGGIGTTIFYIVGGVMVLGAAVLLITRRRMSTR